MILACSSCSKKFRYAGDPANRPQVCPKCKSPLDVMEEAGTPPAPRAAVLAAAAGTRPTDGREGELEARVAALEAELKEAEHLRKDLQEAQASIARMGADLEKVQSAYQDGLRKKDEEARQHQAEREEAQASIARLGTDLEVAQSAYREALAKKEQEIEDLNARLSQGGGEPAAGGTGDLSALRAEMGKKLIEKDRRISELEEQMQTLQEDLDLERARLKGKLGMEDGNVKALDEKIKRVSDLERQVASERARAEELQRRAQNLEQIRKAEHDSFQTRVRQKDEIKAKVNEARYLAGDVEKNMESMLSSLNGVFERVKRLKLSLHSAEPELPPLPVPSLPAVESAPAEEEEVRPVPAVESEPEAPEGADPFANIEPPASGDDEQLPADETLLDLGKVGRAVRRMPESPPPEEEPVPPEEEVRVEADAEESPPAQLPDGVRVLVDGVPVDVPPDELDPPPAEEPPPVAEEPKKKGFFGKLFKKK